MEAFPTHGQDPIPADSKNVVEGKLALFLQRNPVATVTTRGNEVHVEKPWGDSTLSLVARQDDEDLFDALNNVLLPPRFTAIWHKDTKDLEIIWTALPVGQELKARSFSFRLDSSEFKCRFAESSKRLLSIAKCFRPISPATNTNHRNLDSFRLFQMLAKDPKRKAVVEEWTPKSFWVGPVDWDENLVIEITRHLNFFMFYFDRQTPRILVHDDATAGASLATALRFPFADFPNEIRGRTVDRNLLSLWESALEASDTYRRFLYYYQILEYGAFYYLDDKSLKQVKRILASPQCTMAIDDCARQVMDLMIENKMSDEAKIVAIINQMVDPKEIWKELEPYKDYFSVDLVFDGGFSLPALVKADWEEGDFLAAWTPKFPDALRKIRNALVHAREMRMVNVISPTKANYDRLRPWIAPLSLAAMQVMLYRDT
jgi:hypothetical protein